VVRGDHQPACSTRPTSSLPGSDTGRGTRSVLLRLGSLRPLRSPATPVQLEDGRWYFHRTRGEYRGGSFKGLDLALGDGASFFGILIRTVVTADGTILDGPCVTVDHLLAQTKTASVAALDGVNQHAGIWDTTSPLHLVEAEKPRTATVYQSSRVGLSLKKAKGKADAPKFVARPYRYLTEPAGISKGKPHLVLALHRTGHTAEAIRDIIDMPKKTIDRRPGG